MDEDQYRSTYRDIITRQCSYEKAINSRQTSCQQANKIRLADREAIACSSQDACVLCTFFLTTLRSKSLFALKLQNHQGPITSRKRNQGSDGQYYWPDIR